MTGLLKSCIVIGILSVALPAPVSLAQSLPTAICTQVPRLGWVSVEEIEGQLRREGYQLLRVRITNESCIVALVENGQGKQLELRIHPANGEWLGPPQQPMPARPADQRRRGFPPPFARGVPESGTSRDPSPDPSHRVTASPRVWAEGGSPPRHIAKRRLARLRGHAALPCTRLLEHREFGGLQALDLVADARGFLEIEIRRRLAHLLFEIRQHRLEIVADGDGRSACPLSTVTRSRS